MKVLIIIPAYNEEENILVVCNGLENIKNSFKVENINLIKVNLR